MLDPSRCVVGLSVVKRMPPKAPPPKAKQMLDPSPPPAPPKSPTGEDQDTTSSEFETPKGSTSNSDTSTPKTVPLERYNELVARFIHCCVFHLGPTLLLSFLHIMLSSLLLSLIYD